jgi:hypothetical protein
MARSEAELAHLLLTASLRGTGLRVSELIA